MDICQAIVHLLRLGHRPLRDRSRLPERPRSPLIPHDRLTYRLLGKKTQTCSHWRMHCCWPPQIEQGPRAKPYNVRLVCSACDAVPLWTTGRMICNVLLPAAQMIQLCSQYRDRQAPDDAMVWKCLHRGYPPDLQHATPLHGAFG